MKIHCFQHVEFEDLGFLGSYFQKRGNSISYTKFFLEKYEFPQIDEIDLLIIMGGPMSVNEENIYPWIKAEKQFVNAFIGTKKPIVGICLGAQILASCLGSRVYKNMVKEIGWYPVEVCKNEYFDELFSEKEIVFHWHGETFDLPAGAKRLAFSDVCENQAFIYNRILGLQFHIEVTQKNILALMENCKEDLSCSGNVQNKDVILQMTEENCTRVNFICSKLFDKFLNVSVQEAE